MANSILRIGTRESPLAVWQATQVQHLLNNAGIESELVYIKSEGDKDLITPLYAIGVQGIFTKTLDAALLNKRIDIAVHSLKDVPIQMAEGIIQAAVLKRGSYKDIFVYKDENDIQKFGLENTQSSNIKHQITNTKTFTVHDSKITIATSSVRRIAQWIYRYPNTTIENLRGNVNTRLRKLNESNWNGAIFAAAGLERINIRPENSVDLDWMLPAPAQGAIAVVCRKEDTSAYKICQSFNDKLTALCVKIERDFLKVLMGGCSTPIGGLAEINEDKVVFKGNVLTTDGKEKIDININADLNDAKDLGTKAGEEIISKGADKIIKQIRNDR